MQFSKNRIRLLAGIFLVMISCAKSTGTEAENIPIPPESASLIYPENNTDCNDGIVVSETETDVLFQWQSAPNTGSYILTINNLKDGSAKKINTKTTEFLVRLQRGTAYSWRVKSVGLNNSGNADSELWRFYNAGNPQQSYPPFPANVIYPESGNKVTAGSILLQWETTDIDNDIASYQVLLDNLSTPEKVLGVAVVTNITASVSSGEVYYWQVITTDLLGNQSNSPIFQFQVE